MKCRHLIQAVVNSWGSTNSAFESCLTHHEDLEINSIFNNTKNYQFTSDLSLKGKTLDIVDEVKLLGVIISNDLKWDKHVQKIVTEANIRMKLHQNSQKVLVI